MMGIYLIKKKTVLSSKVKSEYSINIYGALDVRIFLNKRLNVDSKNSEIWVSYRLKGLEITFQSIFLLSKILILLSNCLFMKYKDRSEGGR